MNNHRLDLDIIIYGQTLGVWCRIMGRYPQQLTRNQSLIIEYFNVTCTFLLQIVIINSQV